MNFLLFWSSIRGRGFLCRCLPYFGAGCSYVLLHILERAVCFYLTHVHYSILPFGLVRNRGSICFFVQAEQFAITETRQLAHIV